MALDAWYNWVSFLLGLLLVALGGIPLLNALNVVSWSLPGFVTGLVGNIFLYLVALGGLWLLIDAYLEYDTARMVSLVVGLVVLAAGLIPLLNQFGVIAFSLPFLTVTVYNVIFVVEGVLLVLGGFLG